MSAASSTNSTVHVPSIGIGDLPFPPPPAKRGKGVKNGERIKSKEFTLPRRLILDQWIIPANTVVVLYTSENFGWVCLPEGCQDTRGFTIPRNLFKY